MDWWNENRELPLGVMLFAESEQAQVQPLLTNSESSLELAKRLMEAARNETQVDVLETLLRRLEGEVERVIFGCEAPWTSCDIVGIVVETDRS